MRSRPLLILLVMYMLAGCASQAESSSDDSGISLDPLAAQGKAVFTRECSSCHSLVEGTVVVGPSMSGIATRAETRAPDNDAPRYILTSILRPCEDVVDGFQCLMPENFGKKLTGEELDALVAFLLTLD